MRRRVTFSRNHTLSLSRTCQCFCKYCAFKTHKAHLYAPGGGRGDPRAGGPAQRQGAAGPHRRAARGQRRGPRAAGRLRPRGLHELRRLGVRARARARAAAAHQPRGALQGGPRPPARGDRLAGADARVDPRRPRRPPGLADQGPARRLQTIRWAGELKIPFTSGILVGIGETPADRIAALEALAAVHAEHGHLQEIILQNFVPHDSYYGQEPAQIADAAAQGYWRTGYGGGAAGPSCRCPAWATPVSHRGHARARRGHAGAACPAWASRSRRTSPTGGPSSSRRARPTSAASRANGDHISPSTRSPGPTRSASSSSRSGYALTERLCVYPQYIEPEWVAPGVLDTIRQKYWSFIPRRGSGRREAPSDPDRPRAGRDREGPRRRRS